MQHSELPVIAAIPNYNMADSLQRLLPQVIAEGYDHIYVLDDASTDNSRQVVASFGKQVTFVAGTENLCSGGNRNRIIKALTTTSLIHFLDADVELTSRDVPATIRRLMNNPNIGFIGGLVTDTREEQSPWNFGPRFCLQSSLAALLQFFLTDARTRKFVPAKRFLAKRVLLAWPDITQPAARRETYWVHEANMMINSEVFATLGGFDQSVRSHDIMDLSIRAQKAGFVSLFNPSISIRQHNDKNVRPGSRRKARHQATFYLIRKNGLWQYLFPNGHFIPRHNHSSQ